MGSEYDATMGDLLDHHGGDIQTGPFGTKLKAAEYSEVGVPVVSVGEVGDGRLRVKTDSRRVGEDVTSRMPEYLLRPGDIVFGRKGAVERSAQVQPHEDGYFLGSDGIRVRLPADACDARFIAYQLQAPTHKAWMLQNAAGSTMPSLNEGIVRRIPLVLPPLSEQRAIAEVLGSLDDKIELNRRMNRTLESMARALFKSWFVDFDPVHANAAGQPTLPPDLAALFPASFEPSALGEIPEGWEVRSIGDIGQVICGKTPSTNDPTNFGGNIPFVTIPDMHGKTFVGATRRYLSKSGAETQIRKQLPSGAICVSCIATPGLVVMTTEPSQTNQQINSIIPKIMDHRYFWLSAVQRQGDAIASGGSGGSVFHNLNKSRFEKLRIISPPGTVIEAYCDATSPIFARLRANSAECDTLASLRDALLPKLLSGELRSPDAKISIARCRE